MAQTGFFPIEFIVTPRFDVFYALYTLSSGTSTPLDPWKEKALARLPREFERQAKRVAPLPIFWPLLADAIQSVPGELAFDEMLSSIREMPAEVLQGNVLSGIFHDQSTVDSLVARKKTLTQVLADESLSGGELLGHFGLRPYKQSSPSASAIGMLLSKPKSFRDELAQVLKRFWQNGFRDDWSALERELRAESLRMSDLREERSAGDFSRELNLPVVFDDDEREIRPRSGAAIGYDRVDRCYMIPSAFNARRWWAKYETKAQRVTIYFPITTESGAPNALGDESRNLRGAPNTSGAERGKRSDHPAKDPGAINAESVFRALGDTTRYAIASILARTPTTSAELARSLKVSKPTITHHIHALRSAGLISEIPSGGSTKLALSRDTVAALSGAAVEQLFSSTGELALETTRKRRSS
jgi:DNA-binding transcriptional ArsR family regulator